MTTLVEPQASPTTAKSAAPAFPTAQLITAMIKGREHVSDLIFSPGHAPQVESSGQLAEIKFQGLERLTPEHTRLTPTFALALRAALRQAPKIILVGEMRDRETIEIALEAAETGHLVLSTLHTIDASKTVERIVGVFPLSDQQSIRSRFAKAFRFIISQRLIPRRDGKGRVAALEILKSTMRTREYVEKGENEGKSLVDAMNDGAQEGMQHFDGELETLIRDGTVELEAGLSYSTNAGNLRLALADFIEEQAGTKEAEPSAERA